MSEPDDLAPRDRLVVSIVARFRQLSSHHIRSLAFDSIASTTPSDRALKRLVDRSYLHRIERRMVGGAKGGSGQYAYSLGRRGYYMFFDGSFSPARTVSYHTLAVADAYLALRQLHQAGTIDLHGFATEPDCWRVVGRIDLRPDLYVDMTVRGERLRAWLEVDMGTESQRRIKATLEDYWRAYNAPEAEEWVQFPLILWVACDDERAKELSWLVSELPPEQQILFRVTTVEGLPELVG